MKAFSHTNAKTLAEASTACASGKATIIAGGTDLIGRLKDNILPTYPAALINIKTIPGLDYIKEEGGVLKIGATTRLADIAAHPVVKQKYTALAQAAAGWRRRMSARWELLAATWLNCTAAGISASRRTVLRTVSAKAARPAMR